jgi:N-acetylneuraminic acid mutarotase
MKRLRTWYLLAATPLLVTACTRGDAGPVLIAANSEERAVESTPGPTAWSTAAPLPEQRTEVSATTDGSRLFLIGGFGPPTREGQRASAPRGMWVYDPQSDSWSDGGQIPEGVHHAGFVHLDGRLFIVGGFRETGFEPTPAVRIYDLARGTWSEGSPMPTPRGAMAVAVLNGRIHAVGGNVAGRDALHEHHAGAEITEDNSVAVHEVYDPRTDRWETLPPMRTPRNHHAGIALNGRLHVVAGRAQGDFELTEHEIFDPSAGSWIAGPPLPTGRSGVAVVERGGHLYVFGGETFNEPRRTFADAERFDPRSGSWERLPEMPTARHGLAAAVLGNNIHVVSGGPQPAFTYGDTHEVLSLGGAR